MLADAHISTLGYLWFQGFLSPYSFDRSSYSVGPASQDTQHQGRDERKCSVM